MSNQPITDIILQTSNGFYKIPFTPGTVPAAGSDVIVFAMPDGSVFTFPRATPDPALTAAGPVFFTELDSPGVVETTDANGVVHWVVAKGAAVTAKVVQPGWAGKPGDAPPPTSGNDAALIAAMFTEANRVDA